MKSHFTMTLNFEPSSIAINRNLNSLELVAQYTQEDKLISCNDRIQPQAESLNSDSIMWVIVPSSQPTGSGREMNTVTKHSQWIINLIIKIVLLFYVYPRQMYHYSLVLNRYLSTVTVVGNEVGAAAEGASDPARGSKSLDAVGDSSRSGKTLKDLEVESKTSNVGASHGSSADGVGSGGGADPGGQNVDTGAEDINTGTVVGERSSAPARVDGSNGQGVGSVGRRLARDGERVAIVITVTGSDNGEDTSVVSSVDGSGPGGRRRSAWCLG